MHDHVTARIDNGDLPESPSQVRRQREADLAAIPRDGARPAIDIHEMPRDRWVRDDRARESRRLEAQGYAPGTHVVGGLSENRELIEAPEILAAKIPRD